ncbi:MAG TPA: prepilin-type N-terminal cleavage/methylation domain-containing protein [Candidatus Angelobacter sp.]
MSHSPRKRRRQHGFSLLETIIAIVVLAVGLLGAAALMAQMAGSSAQSRYMSTESLLTSEKLDELNRLPRTDPTVTVAVGTNTVGSLTADVTASQTVGANTETVPYFDQVQISSGNGAMQEVITSTDAGGALGYTVITHLPDGTAQSTFSPTSPVLADSSTLTFKRRWTIENDTPVPHSRRITVRVTLQAPGNPSFQSSMVRSFTPDPICGGC